MEDELDTLAVEEGLFTLALAQSEIILRSFTQTQVGIEIGFEKRQYVVEEKRRNY